MIVLDRQTAATGAETEHARPIPSPGDYPFHSREKLRYGDQDRQGHVNNAVYATFFETGRVELLTRTDLKGEGGVFVLARLAVDYRREIHWPGEVLIGTRVAAVGRSSIRFEHAVFSNGQCAAQAESVVVLMDKATRRSRPFSGAARAWLEARQASVQPSPASER